MTRRSRTNRGLAELRGERAWGGCCWPRSASCRGGCPPPSSAAVTGVLLLAVFKYTSNQARDQACPERHQRPPAGPEAIQGQRGGVSLQAQGRILLGAFRLFVLAIVPMLVMAVPVTLLLGQLALWYQARPLRVGEDAVVTLKLNGDAATAWPPVSLEPTDAVEVKSGPVRVRSQRDGLLEPQGPRAW